MEIQGYLAKFCCFIHLHSNVSPDFPIIVSNNFITLKYYTTLLTFTELLFLALFLKQTSELSVFTL